MEKNTITKDPDDLIREKHEEERRNNRFSYADEVGEDDYDYINDYHDRTSRYDDEYYD